MRRPLIRWGALILAVTVSGLTAELHAQDTSVSRHREEVRCGIDLTSAHLHGKGVGMGESAIHLSIQQTHRPGAKPIVIEPVPPRRPPRRPRRRWFR